MSEQGDSEKAVDIKDLISSQRLILERIKKMRINYGKDSADRKTQSYLDLRIDLLKEKWTTFKETHRAIMNEYTVENNRLDYFKNDIYGEVEDLYVDLLSEMQQYQKTNFEVVTPNPANVENNNESQRPKLPTINLPKFNGEYTSWTSFYDLFLTLIHANDKIPKVQKLYYLKTHLTDEAEQLLRHVTITEANYQTAWETLVERYDNKRVLVNTQLTILLSQRSLTVESSEGIKGLLDTTSECLKALQNLELDTISWDPIIIYLTTQKLPAETHQMWEHSISTTKELPTFACLKEFLEARFRTLEVVGSLHFKEKEKHTKSKSSTLQAKSLHIQTHSNTCYYCQEKHHMRHCSSYLQLDVSSRVSIAKEKGLCLNCLTKGHPTQACYSQVNCKFCGQRHHQLLHYKRNSNFHTSQGKEATNSASHKSVNNSAKSENISTSLHSSISTKVLLATALININSPNGIYTLRALLDQGSQTSFITESAVQLLKLQKIKVDAIVKGIGNNIKQSCRNKVNLNITSTKQDISISTEAIVLRTITELIPTEKIVAQNWPHIAGLSLADPDYLQPGKIDVLLGADVYSEILRNGLKQGPPNTPVAQNTIFGWIISGKTSNYHNRIAQRSKIVNFHNRIEIDNLLKRFWEIEEMPTNKENTEEEIECETIFEKTHLRDNTGRYIVNLPFKERIETPSVGKSRHIAMARFMQTEKRFMHKEKLKESYANCITEYLQLEHMKPIDRSEEQCLTYIDGKPAYHCYYVPHHPVLKAESSTTKLRVVFNASQKSASGISLNDILMTGPTIQDDLKAILLRWRLFKYAYSADIEKMYRQIVVSKEQQEYQRILWRNSHKEEMKEFCLTRVTFGFTSAAFLAIRSLQQLSYDEGGKYPLVKDILLNDFYVDNVLYGADSLSQAKEQREQLISLLESGGFPLKKWSASHASILEGLPENYKEVPNEKDIDSALEIKTLGVLWNTNGDFFSYNFVLNPVKVNTKRTAASIIAKIFDPLGWCAPVTVAGKILLQSLWLIEVEWDDELPKEICEQFRQYQNSLREISKVQIPRWVGTSSDSAFEIHGFCDASNKAYAAAIYIKLLEETGEQRIFLLAAATKVAPIKTISLPRLELCGALLLSKLCKYYLDALKIKPASVYAWTDSKIVLSWLNGYPNKWKCFVANRVTEIKTLMLGATWRHVPSKDNPADCASRGINVTELLTHELWWSGPGWLNQKEQAWPKSEFYETKEEIKNTKTLTAQIMQPPSFITRYSKLNKLIRVTAYIFRFIRKCKNGVDYKTSKWLSSTEIESALFWLIRRKQEFNFSDEIKNLKSNINIPVSSRLIKLHPFLDKEGVLRVGGRLQSSDIPYEGKHPIILDNKCFLTELIIRHTHIESLHGGPQLSINILRQRYWILNVRNIVPHIINKCVTCVKQKGICGKQLMGSLPQARITKSRPFSHTGIDYCGPFNIRLSKGRGTKSQKSYIAIFICLSVKAIHIELVSDLSTPSFLAALRRFVSRRGLPSDIYSDCGSNFVGASRVIDKDLDNCIKNQQEEVAEKLANENVTWHFNPPAAPNFGGLWEAGVKSTKFHLKALLHNRLLTYEEMTTVLAQIEASLNSRPISPLTNDIEDMTAITPGHFLVGAPLKSIPEPSLLQVNENHLTRWHFVQQLSQHFWKRWHQEYLNHLQQRQKWNQTRENLTEGDMVLIKEQNLPPNTWLLGRIVTTYPGTDKLTRVVDIKTKNGIFKRPITKLCKLPIS